MKSRFYLYFVPKYFTKNRVHYRWTTSYQHLVLQTACTQRFDNDIFLFQIRRREIVRKTATDVATASMASAIAFSATPAPTASSVSQIWLAAGSSPRLS